MKTKNILSLLIVFVFAILGAGSFDKNGNLEGWVWCVILIVAIFIFFAIISGWIHADEVEKKKEQARIQREEKQKAQTEEYNALKQQFLTTNGMPDKSLVISQLDINSEIHVYETAKKIFIMGKEYAFKDIISCTFSDSPRVIKGRITAVTKSNNSSVIGRSIVGDVVAGPAGAIIGGTTAKKNTEYVQDDDRTIHDYTVIINMDSITEPIIRIHTGEDGELTNEIVGLMNVIIKRK